MANESEELKPARQTFLASILKCSLIMCPRDVKRLLILLWLALCVSTVEARFNEDEVRAAYLFHIIKYIDWPKPDKSDNTITICVLFNKSTRKSHSVFQLQGKKSVKGELDIVPLDEKKPKKGCEVIYAEKADKKQLMTSIDQYGQAKTLVVTSEAQTYDDVAMIGLLRVKDNIRIFVNLPRVSAKELHISSQLLEVAEVTK